eukprot:1198290-Amphidinium_carterae.1
MEESTMGPALSTTDTEYHQAYLALFGELARINAIVSSEHSSDIRQDDLGMEVLMAISNELDDYGKLGNGANIEFGKYLSDSKRVLLLSVDRGGVEG